MKITKLRIDGQVFYLSAGTDIAALKSQILNAASGTPEFIEFEPAGYGKVSVLMTPHTPVRLEEEDHAEEEIQGWTQMPPEIDAYGFHALVPTDLERSL